MHQQDLKAAAQSLRFAMELGATGAVFQQKVQQVVLQLGGSVDVSKLSTGTAALYLIALLFSNLENSA